jgi:tetratricopeptide (TPR) repeat protein
MKRLSIVFLVFLFIYSCATGKGVRETPLTLFNRILEISTTAKDRQAVLPEMEALYRRIINEFPDSPLAQESCMRLIRLYLEEHSPPAIEEAEEIYSIFTERYPHSIFRNTVIESMAKAYSRTGQWEKLLEITSPVFERYTRNGVRPGPAILLMYGEANLRLGHIEEARKGYETAINLYPALKQDRRLMDMLDKLNREEGN